LALVLAGCDPAPEVTTQDECDLALDQGDWDTAIDSCGQIQTDEGYSKTAQAYMGRAGISLLGLIEKVADTDLEGLALILNVFTVNATQLQDVQQAINFMLLIGTRTNTDYFNLIVASDVALATLLKNALNITIDPATGAITIPGITDSNIEDLSATSPPATIQSILDDIYKATYYSTSPPIWDDSDPAKVDLKAISSFVQANAIGSTVINLGDLTDLDFASAIDNGQCGLSTGQTASGANNAADGPTIAQFFPRRLNTSHSSALYLVDELRFVLLDLAGKVDNTREWKGGFLLPSRLLNPDFVGINCGAGLGLNKFTTCLASGAKLNTNFTEVKKSDLATNITCGAAACAASASSGWPVTSADGDVLTDEFAAEGAANMTHLANVLHQLYPVDNGDSNPATSGLHCQAGDGWVHAREYDYYLRAFGQ
jgi:hypothetical protein